MAQKKEADLTKVRLSRKVRNHIVTRHPETKPYISKILETVKNPDVIVRGRRGELKALKLYSSLHIGTKYLIVVYRELYEEKVIITAYFTSNLSRVKGEAIWQKRQ